jgi:branched-chain amino acid transport system substrate-binding protein
MVRESGDRANRRSVLKTAGGLVTVAGLAGCSDGDGDGGGGDGGVTNTDQSNSDPIKIGMITPLQTGSGKDMRDGAKLAIDQINNNGGILGRNLKLLPRDSELDAGKVNESYTELTLKEEVDLTMGGWLGPGMKNIMSGIAESQTLHFNPGSALVDGVNNLINNDYDTYKYHFRFSENGMQAAEKRFEFVKDKFEEFGWKKVGLLTEDLGWNAPIQSYMIENFPNVGPTLEADIRYSIDTEDFSTIFDQMESNDVDVVLGFNTVSGRPSIPQWFKQERNFAYAATISAAQQSNYWRSTNGECRYFVNPIPVVPGQKKTDLTVPFQNKFFNSYNHYPRWPAYNSHEAIRVFEKVAKEAETVESEPLVPLIENVEMKTVLGLLRFHGRDNRFTHDSIQDDKRQWTYSQWQEKNGKGVETADMNVEGNGIQEDIWVDKTDKIQPVPWAN